MGQSPTCLIDVVSPSQGGINICAHFGVATGDRLVRKAPYVVGKLPLVAGGGGSGVGLPMGRAFEVKGSGA